MQSLSHVKGLVKEHPWIRRLADDIKNAQMHYIENLNDILDKYSVFAKISGFKYVQPIDDMQGNVCGIRIDNYKIYLTDMEELNELQMSGSI